MSEPSGPHLAHYRLIERLGQGGMGVVFRADDTLLHRPVALKFLLASGSGPEAEHQQARFLREARTAAALNHPNVCTIYHVAQVEPGADLRLVGGAAVRPGTPYIVMELIEGQTLSETLQRTGRLELGQLLGIAVQIAEALEEAHSRGIVHRDLKPGNVMVGAGGRVKIVDFGLARVAQVVDLSDEATGEKPTASALTRAGTILGTLSYMSPEQIQAQPVGPAADVFSFGILLHELATGRRPFQGETEASTLAKILEAEAEPLRRVRPDAPVELEGLIGRCLRKRAEERPETREVARSLRALRQRFGTSAEVASLVEPRQEAEAPPTRVLRPRRRSLAIAAVATAVLVLAAVGGWVLLRPVGGIPGASVAVLPLLNTSEDAYASDYLADGIAEGAIRRLTRAGVAATPWVTTSRFRATDLGAAELAKELAVDAVLSGQFSMDDDEGIRLAVTLAARDGHSTVSTELHDPDADPLALQRALAMWIGERLEGVAAAERGALSESISANHEAYDLYLQGTHALWEGGEEGVANAEQLFQKATELDPTLADAWVGRGAAALDRGFFGWGGQAMLADAEHHFSEALRLDPNLTAARRGLIRINFEKGLSEPCLIQGHEVARLGRDADFEALVARGEAYVLGGLPDLAVPLLEQVRQLDAGNVGAHWFHVIAAAWAGEYDLAIRSGTEFLERFRNEPPSTLAEVHLWVAVAHDLRGEVDAARKHYEDSLRLFRGTSNHYAAVYAGSFFERLGQKERALQIWRDARDALREILERHPDNLRMRFLYEGYLILLGEESDLEPPFEELRGTGEVHRELLSAAYAARGLRDAAIETLEHGLTRGYASGGSLRITMQALGVNVDSSGPYAEILAKWDAALGRLRELYGR